MVKTSISVGLNKGFPTQKLEQPARIAKGKGKTSKATLLARSVVREVAGLAPYEKRLLDVLKTGGATSEKRMYKLAKSRLGTHKRALRKREEIKRIYSDQRARQTQG